MNSLIKYNNGEIELTVSFEKDTIWLTQKQIAELFNKDVRTINEHIKAIYKEQELNEDSTIRKFRIVQKEGNREVSRDVSHYNLDAIISIGYRVNSKKATKFRQWATSDFKVYNIGNNAPVSLMEFIETLENALEKKAEKNYLPMQDGDVVSTYADVSDLINDFGYKPDTDLADGIGEFVKWYKKFLWEWE